MLKALEVLLTARMVTSYPLTGGIGDTSTDWIVPASPPQSEAGTGASTLSVTI